MNRYRDRIRRAVFARPYVPPDDNPGFPTASQDLPTDGETALAIALLATVPAGNGVTITIPAGCPIQIKYIPD